MKTVLLTDDNEDIVELLQLVLGNSGYRLLTASDGRKAVEIGLEEEPDLVLMDLNMPGMNGFEAVTTLRERGFEKPIIVLTASESEADRQKAIEVGCTDYVLKNLDMNGVEKILDHYLADSGGID